ncbi:murein biosynthesis integral membrane protein MurJ [Rickettsia prowazekii]|uniref:Probable lipid II flippase MurJ n=2 Tax=Rickettsia prowazekii TaxID=782 RepID=MURJ_RICPR|nr:murein biosynthesis integral membrane protein MurJ [Rickettsia prowazekii]Q9ZCW4.1 RecName: Full=Probable lipid II flippase MurJ [Rickettsia prowazekii str. Madrid E]ADE30126.1 Integral membrane protein MviN [Rickettsia prowazekii str. Rp22]AFE49391.1 virulence factor MVIN (mviN) [Rickettsia prowazekii str. Chernikova]AFE51081.1 virulence factor MVIN (mviN) [Rickettsia prowazekii str. BuV67-CWPP]AFE51918.1 virulence factor MVIN (mviN) [Rickettsia prowazekii str. Dachau]AMS12478.1 multidrug
MTLFRSGIILAFLTFIARIFGLVREQFIASLFGSTPMGDSMNIAFKLPNLFRRIFAEGALSSVFIPIYNEKMLISKKAANNFSGKVFTLLSLTLIVIIALMQIFMPQLILCIAPGFYAKKEKFELTVFLCRITIPYLIFVSLTALLGGILNSVKKFAAFAFSPIILSVCVIIFTLIFGNYIESTISISVSLIIAGILQVVFMFICVKKADLHFPIIFHTNDPDVKKLLINMGPATISSGVQQLNLFISQSISSFIEGAISILAYADRIYQFPLSIIGTSFSTILLPEMSKVYKSNDIVSAQKIQNNAIRIGLLLSLPATFGIIILSHPITNIIYERGVFTPQDTTNTAEAISAFALGLPAFILAKILTPIFYANGDTKTPLKITLFSIIINTNMNLLLMDSLKHIGIAVGTSIAAWYNLGLLYSYSTKQHKLHIEAGIKLFCAKILLCCTLMSIIIALIKHYYLEYLYSEYLLIKVSMLGSTIIIGVAIFFGTAYLLKVVNYDNSTK